MSQILEIEFWNKKKCNPSPRVADHNSENRIQIGPVDFLVYSGQWKK